MRGLKDTHPRVIFHNRNSASLIPACAGWRNSLKNRLGTQRCPCPGLVIDLHLLMLENLGGVVLEPTLMVIGINFHTAPVGVRERFWISPGKRRQALAALVDAEGIEGVLVLATCKRTEFLLWANDATLAANSILRLLCSEYSLQLCEWEHFYRLLGEDAVTHVFRVASGLDSMITGDPEAAVHLQQAWQEAKQSDCAGPALDSVLEKAFAVSEKLRQSAGLEQHGVSVASIAVETAQEILESLENRTVVLIGAGRMGELAAASLMKRGVSQLRILNRTLPHALELAGKVEGTAVPFEDLLQEISKADLVISCTASPQPLLSEQQARQIVRQRKGRMLCIVDLGLPRNIAPEIRELDGVFLYDLDDVRRTLHAESGRSAVQLADSNLVAEAKEFQRSLAREHVVPMIVALRSRLSQICQAELEAFRRERGPFLREQDRLLGEFTSRLTQGVATSLVRQLKEVHEKSEQQHIADAVQRLFHLGCEKELLTTK
jgi:glutamyl-tRNA reductase